MSVNGVTGSTNTYTNYSAKTENSQPKTDNAKAAEKVDAAANSGVVYEPSKNSDAASKKATYKPNTEMIDKLKMDSEAHVRQLEDIVNKLLTKQGDTFNVANGLKSFYQNLQVDDETRAQAQKDIAEDGYWGVDQTSSRIFDFAMALTGGDPEKMEKMRGAFEKGFSQATKAWGDELPDICQKTYGAVLSKFDDYASQFNQEETE